jgi:hypothetical protein
MVVNLQRGRYSTPRDTDRTTLPLDRLDWKYRLLEAVDAGKGHAENVLEGFVTGGFLTRRVCVAIR